jgi:hypothetical protein
LIGDFTSIGCLSTCMIVYMRYWKDVELTG